MILPVETKMIAILTLNLNFRCDKHGAWPDRKRRVAALVRTQQPDILALQAVERDGADQAAELASELPGYGHVLFQSAESGSPRKGCAFVSRLPILSHASLALPLVDQTEDPYPRIAIDARFSAGASVVRVVNAHLSWVESQGRDNARRLVEFVSRDSHPALIVGDFNATPGSRALTALTGAGWKDLWELRGAADAGYTFESHEPRIRIDYIWANDGLIQRVEDLRVVGASATGERLSDHLGLLARFSAS